MLFHAASHQAKDFPAKFAKNFVTGNLEALSAGCAHHAKPDLGEADDFCRRNTIGIAFADQLGQTLPLVGTGRRPNSCPHHNCHHLQLGNPWHITLDGSTVTLAGRAVDLLRKKVGGKLLRLQDLPFVAAATTYYRHPQGADRSRRPQPYNLSS